MPTAVKLVASPLATEAVVGLIEIAVNTGVVTVKVALLEVMPLAEAAMVVMPCARLEAMPLVLTVATVALLEDHVADPETFPELPSE